MDSLFAISLFCIGGCFCILNFYLSFLRYPLHKRKCGDTKEYKWVSGAPILGSLFVAISLLYFYPISWICILGLILIAIDTGGIHWFVGAMIGRIAKRDKK